MRGDDCLSSVDHQLWSIVNHVLLHWHTLVIFKWQMYNVPKLENGFIQFFVPYDAEKRDEIIAFLEHELEPLKLEAAADWPGRDIEIYASIEIFNGLEPYMERDKSEAIARRFAEDFLRRIKREDKTSPNL